MTEEKSPSNSDPPNNVVSLIKAFETPAKRVEGRKASEKPTPAEGGGGDEPPLKITGDDESTWPVKALGVRGDRFYFLDAMGQLRDLKASEFGRLGIKGLFGHKNHLIEDAWPRYGRKGIVHGADYDVAASALIGAAALKGVWDVFGRTRGSGSWLGEDGKLILHCGDVVLIDSKKSDPGMIGRFVYPADKPFLRPWEKRVTGGSHGPAQSLLTVLQSWNWKRGELDARLLLGWIGSAMIAGAIGWRPVVWITGGRSTGKSTLQRWLSLLFDGALIAVSDASAAGVWQKLGHSTLPVTLDEVEAEEDNRRGQGLIRFARQAASGGLVLRGGADHGASEFTARSCFLFSSILIPPLSAQDRSRMAILELGELKAQAEPEMETRKMRDAGQRMLRRLVDGWPRWNETLSKYRAGLSANGHSARGADVFGTLLAAADLLLEDGELHDDNVAGIVEQLNVASLAEAEDDLGEEERCINHLRTQAIPLDGVGMRRLVGEWASRAAGILPSEEDEAGGPTRFTMSEASRILGRYGLKCLQEGEDKLFAIASDHAELQKLFQGTHWAGRSGSAGVWTQALRRLPGARPSGKTIYFAGNTGKATFLPLCNVLSDPDKNDIRLPTDWRFRFENNRGQP